MKIEDLFKQADTILEDEKLREMFKKCFLSTLETSVIASWHFEDYYHYCQ